METPLQPGTILTCQACGYTWRQRKPQPPRKCSRCQSLKWNQPRPTPIEILGPPPEKMGDLADKQMGLIAKNLEEEHSLLVDVMDANTWAIEGLDKVKDYMVRSRNHAATALSLLEAVWDAGKPRLLPPSTPAAGAGDTIRTASMELHADLPATPAAPPPEKPATAAAPAGVHKRDRTRVHKNRGPRPKAAKKAR